MVHVVHGSFLPHPRCQYSGRHREALTTQKAQKRQEATWLPEGFGCEDYWILPWHNAHISFWGVDRVEPFILCWYNKWAHWLLTHWTHFNSMKSRVVCNDSGYSLQYPWNLIATHNTGQNSKHYPQLISSLTPHIYCHRLYLQNVSQMHILFSISTITTLPQPSSFTWTAVIDSLLVCLLTSLCPQSTAWNILPDAIPRLPAACHSHFSSNNTFFQRTLLTF